MKKSIVNKTALGVACFLGVGAAIGIASNPSFLNRRSAAVHADEAVSYISKSWDSENNIIVKTTQTCSTYEVVSDSTTKFEDGKWYVVNSNVVVSDRITTEGTANLILCDGYTLTANGGISVNYGTTTLNIFSQQNDNGILVASSDNDNNAAIGSNYNWDQGKINIYGGDITAHGGLKSAGIGRGYYSSEGTITIYGGTITASSEQYGAGIGGGHSGNGGTITIYDGTIVATSGSGTTGDGAGIGASYYGDDTMIVNIYGGDITAKSFGYGAGIGGANLGAIREVNIYGGDINAIGGPFGGAGIGGGYKGHGADVTINDGTVITVGGTGAAGIGQGAEQIYSNHQLNYDYSTGLCLFGDDFENPTTKRTYSDPDYDSTRWPYMTVKLDLPEVSYITRSWDSENKKVIEETKTCNLYKPVTSELTSWGNDKWYVFSGTGLMDGRIVVNGTANLIIEDGAMWHVGISVNEGNTLNIYGQSEGKKSGQLRATGIGGDANQNGGTINIYSGTIYSNGDGEGAAIGGGANANGGEITIYGGEVNAGGTNRGAGIGGGNKGDGGTITIYGGKVDSGGGSNGGSGIGGGSQGNGGIINIYGGEIGASGSASDVSGAGIGGGNKGNGGTVTIYGGFISTGGGYSGAGIGGGYQGSGGDVVVYDGRIIASGGNENAAGIGKGDPGGVTGLSNGTLVVDNDTLAVYGDYVLQTDYYDNDRWTSMDIRLAHQHNWSYSASGSSITATCNNPDCSITTGLTLTLQGEEYYTYTGSDLSSSISFASGYSEVAFGSSPTINFFDSSDNPVAACIDVGTYKAKVTFGEATAVLTFNIVKKNIEPSEYTVPTAKTNLIYNGEAQSLINAGSATCGTMKYRLASTSYSTDIPSGTDAGDYTVYYKVFGDSNHNDTEEASLVVSIAKASPTPIGTLEASYGQFLSDVALPSGWAWDDDPTTSVGDAGSRVFGATFAEQENYKETHQSVTINVATIDPDPVGELNATYGDTLGDVALPAGWVWNDPLSTTVGDVGSNDFYATYTPIDGNHHAKTSLVTINVAQATPTPDIPTGLVATYGDKLSSVTLPSGWAWKNPEDSVGNAGERTHAAIFTPDNPNYKSKEENITIIVAKATPTYIVPGTIDAPYNVELSTIGLPEGFSWMDGSQKTSTWGESIFKAKYTPSDTANYNIVENIDIKVNVKWILVDPTQGDVTVTINDGNEGFDVNISVKVEVKTEISTEQKRTDYANVGRDFVKPDEDIKAIYNVKLIRTIDGFEQEIQPSDIKEGTKITVSMPIPTELIGNDFRLLHIKNSDSTTEIENYAVTKDGKTLVVEIDKVGEFAFIGHTDKPNGFDYSTGLPGWAIALIIVGSILLLCLLCFFLLFFVFNKWIRKDDKAIRAVKFGKKDNKVRLLVMPFRFEYRQEAEVFDTKQEALKE